MSSNRNNDVTIAAFEEGAPAPQRTWSVPADHAETFMKRKRDECKERGWNFKIRVMPAVVSEHASIEATEDNSAPAADRSVVPQLGEVK